MPLRSQYSRPIANRAFTNREQHLARFHAAYTNSPQDHHHILVFHGIGGQGKTALCRKFREILAAGQPRRAVWGHLDLEIVDFREPAHGLLQLRKSLRESGKIKFTAFDIAIASYWEKAYPTEDPAKALKDLLGDSEGVLGAVADNAPSWLDMAQELPAGLGLGVKGLLYARKKLKEHRAKQTVEALAGLETLDTIELLRKLPYFLGIDLCAHREETDAPLPVLFIDAYEALWSDKPDKSGFAAVETDAWMRELVTSAPGTLFVVFGRERLNWDERFPHNGWAEVLRDQHRLDGLADRDAETFLCRIPVEEPELRRAMIEAAKGEPDGDESTAQREARGAHPFYLDLAVDIYLGQRAAGHAPKPEDFGFTHADLLGRFLRYRTQEERETLKLLSAPRSFDEELFGDLVREFGTHYPLTAFDEFTGFSFIEAGEDGRFRLHGLMRDQLYAALDGKLRARLESFLFGWYDARCQPATPRDVTAQHEVALREAVYHLHVETAEAALVWFWKRERVFTDAARYAMIEPLKRWALDLAENRLGSENPGTAIALNNLAILLQANNRLAEAETLMQRALAIDEQSYGPQHPSVAIDLNNLAQLLNATNRLAEAEPLMRRVLAIDEQSYGPQHPSVAIDLNNLAVLLQATNRLAEAEPLMRRALAIDEQSYGPEHPNVAIHINNLAQLLQDTNRLAEAEPFMRRALVIDEQSYGLEHPNVAIRLNNLAQLLQDTNRLAEAELLMRRALAIDEQSYGPKHPNIAIHLNNLAALLQDTNRLAETEPLMRRVLAIDEQSYGPEHPNVAILLNNLALLLQDTNRLAEAERLSRRQLAIFLKFTRATGHEHPHLLTAIDNYIDLLQAQHLPQTDIQTRLAEATEAAGYSAAEWREMAARLAGPWMEPPQTPEQSPDIAP